MIFNEIFSIYYSTVSKILSAAIDKSVSDRDIEKIITENAFSESVLTIMPALKNRNWQLLGTDNSTAIRHAPSIPLTTLEKQWLKAISLDSRIRLFGADFTGLENVAPLFTPEDYYVFDRYGDGDDYTDEKYIGNFRTVMKAVKEHLPLKIEMLSRTGSHMHITVMPDHLEYSEKDDKFRLVCKGGARATVVNLGRIVSCCITDEPPAASVYGTAQTRTVTMELTDERNALERVMLHFAHFEKQAEKTGENTYRITVWYDRSDETEMVIRILSFGPFVKVVSPQHFIDLIVSRLRRQRKRL